MTPAATISVGDLIMFSDGYGDEMGVITEIREPDMGSTVYTVHWCNNDHDNIGVYSDGLILSWKERFAEWKITTGNLE